MYILTHYIFDYDALTPILSQSYKYVTYSMISCYCFMLFQYLLYVGILSTVCHSI